MNTSTNNYDSIEKIIFDEGLRIQSISISQDCLSMFVHLNNSQVIVTPVILYHRLKDANSEALQNYTLIANGAGIHWPELDEDLSLKGFLKEFLWQQVKSKRELVLA